MTRPPAGFSTKLPLHVIISTVNSYEATIVFTQQPKCGSRHSVHDGESWRREKDIGCTNGDVTSQYFCSQVFNVLCKTTNNEDKICTMYSLSI